ncbi:MAG: DUF3854 domain-containing protein [Dehalococcoidales bacterium]|nr:DUF3854 domain-containing protein [Dehalococcoidales bacterium]
MPSIHYSENIPELLVAHYEHLKASAISDDVIRERGYRSIVKETKPSKSAGCVKGGAPGLAELGFAGYQLRMPGILIPLYGADGIIAGYQYRPDKPRLDNRKEPPRPVKYENPPKSSIRIDVPPRCLPMIANPAVPLFVTEGIKKADALASQNVCAIGLTGVWGFLGKNAFDAVTVSTDLKFIAWDGRIVYLVFDSDIVDKPGVKQALDTFCEIIKRKKAQPRILYLPTGTNGEKIGVDDYIAQKHSIDDLVALERDILPAAHTSSEIHDEDYCIDHGAMAWNKFESNHGVVEAVPVPLCTFRAMATEEISEDDGADVRLFYRVRGMLTDNTPLREILVKQEEYDSMSWVTKNWGLRARIRAGNGMKDKIRDAIQFFSSKTGIKMTNIFAHTGWRTINGKEFYLSGSGAIGEGAENILVKMNSRLSRYSIPVPAGDAADALTAFKMSLDFLDTADRSITLPLWAGMFLAPLCEVIEPGFSIFLYGASGSYKSVLSSLALSHYGYFDFHHLPTNWSATANAIEYLCFCAKDAPIIIDDWAPGVDTGEARKLEVKAERIFRAQGNLQGRDRMGPDLKTQTSYTPRGLIITSGEQLPSGHSVTARFFAVRMERSKVYIDKITKAQESTRFYRAAMYYYIQYLQKSFTADKMQKIIIRQQWEKWRVQARDASEHPRLPDAVASLFTGLTLGLTCAMDAGALNKKQMDLITQEAWQLFNEMANEQSSRIEEERPGNRFISAIRAVIRKGTGILKDVNESLTADRMVEEEGTQQRPSSNQILIGWKNINAGKEAVYLDPEASYMAVIQFYKSIDEPFQIKKAATFDDLRRLGITDCSEGRNMKAVWINGQTEWVLKIAYRTIFPKAEEE